jgi:pepF/M3 family oligoendopeptidase
LEAVEPELPRWDMTTVYPSIRSKEFERDLASFFSEIDDLENLCNSKDVRRRSSSHVDAETAADFDKITINYNALLERYSTIYTYIGCHVSADARDDDARSAESRLDSHAVKIDTISTRYIAWVGTMDTAELISHSRIAAAHEYYLREAVRLAEHQMSEAEEELASALRPSSINAWARLHTELTSLLTATVDTGSGPRELPISAVRALSHDSNRDVRRAAYEGEIEAWKTVTVPIAAAMNGVKGFQHTLRERRRYSDPVEPTLQNNAITRKALDSMQSACVESFPDFRRYYAAKARLLGLVQLEWFDLYAPVGASSGKWSWDDAKEFIRQNFGQYSSRMRDFAERSFKESWIDVGPRLGKEGGAYCAGLRPGESRILLNFDGSFTDVSTLAHELGHGYHNLCLEKRLPLQRDLPSTLAETASIFCETLSFDAALNRANRDEKVALLNTSLERDMGVNVDIHSRFLFESRVFQKRAERDLSTTEFNELMVQAQKETYGDDLASYHPYMWAVKGHYYGPTFYNYPYTFGLLFGVGLYARYLDDPKSFRPAYDDLLSSTGMADAATLGKRFGLDIESIAFWRSSLDVVRGQIAEFVDLAKQA